MPSLVRAPDRVHLAREVFHNTTGQLEFSAVRSRSMKKRFRVTVFKNVEPVGRPLVSWPSRVRPR
jgi:hypothetical protein